ncbi:hypothetical protein BVX97_04140 [bacterium E08(2017)]|nr:hypothetical protein BVX97_04140 [bacterium E08(2017)]
MAVFNFVDQTGVAGSLVHAIPDVLSVELFSSGRFELEERAELREAGPGNISRERSRYRDKVDMFVVGSINRISAEDNLLALDVSVINAVNGAVMYAGHHKVNFSGVLNAKAQRMDIAAIAHKIIDAFPMNSSRTGKIIGLTGDSIVINLNETDGARVGMGLLIMAESDSVRDPVTKTSMTPDVYIGEAYIIEVGKVSCKAELAQPKGRISELEAILRRETDLNKRKEYLTEIALEKQRIEEKRSCPIVGDIVRLK